MAIGSNRLVLPLILIALAVTTTYGQRRGSSPDVQDDGRVTFRIDAANAKTVELAGQWPEGRVALERDEGVCCGPEHGPTVAPGTSSPQGKFPNRPTSSFTSSSTQDRRRPRASRSVQPTRSTLQWLSFRCEAEAVHMHSALEERVSRSTRTDY